MIPILFDSTETTFTGNGLGRLADAASCEVTEARNGIFELEMSYLVDGRLFTSLIPGRFIYATHDNSGEPQPFTIYQVDEPLEGFAKVHAWHFSYALRNIIVRPFTATSCADAVDKIVPNSINANPFTFTTDKQVAGTFSLDVPRDVRSLLGGSEGSLLDVYGKGELEYDMYAVKLWLNRGTDRGVTIRYGKNLASLDRQVDASNVFVSAVPYWTGMGDEPPVYYDGIVTRTGSEPGKAVPMDLSEDFDEAPTPAQLRDRCQAKLDASDNYQVKENIEVDFVQLWQTEEYKDIANLERINLCDTVTIEYLRRGITATAKCIKVVYDTLRERYVSMELGEPRTSLAQQINTDVVQPAVAMLPDRASVKSAIDRATEQISGGFGGYIKWKYLLDGTPSEMLIMDSASEATATNIIRLNKNGIGFSRDGGATYANAWTIDGHLNADFITTGKIEDASGLNFWNLVSGQFETHQGKIGPFTIYPNKLEYYDADTWTTFRVSHDGVMFHGEGAAVLVKLNQRLQYQRYINGAWQDSVAYAETDIGTAPNEKSAAMILVDGSAPAIFSKDAVYVSVGSTDFNNGFWGNTWGQGIIYAQGNNPAALWTGNLETAGSTDVEFGIYSFYIIEGQPSGQARQTMVIPKKMLTPSAKWFQIADDTGGIGFTAKRDGADPSYDQDATKVTFTYSNKWGGGSISAIYGVV